MYKGLGILEYDAVFLGEWFTFRVCLQLNNAE
jgi:hypothetical protein